MPNVMAALPNIGRMPRSNAAKTRNPLKLAIGSPKLVNGSQPLVGRSSPYCEDIWRNYRYVSSFSPIADTCLICEDIARQSCAMVLQMAIFGDFFGSCISSEPRAARFRAAS